VAGMSAGGLAAMLHGESMYERIKGIKGGAAPRFGIVPISGFFITHPNSEDVPVFAVEVSNMFTRFNWTGGIIDKCTALMGTRHWKCGTAQIAYRLNRVPMFVVNSALDLYQTSCIYATGYYPRHPHICSMALLGADLHCSLNYLECTPFQMNSMSAYAKDFVSILTYEESFTRRGNGAFINSCHDHTVMFVGAWRNVTVKNVTAEQALNRWWLSNGRDSAANHSFLPCEYYGRWPYQCENSCWLQVALSLIIPPGISDYENITTARKFAGVGNLMANVSRGA